MIQTLRGIAAILMVAGHVIGTRNHRLRVGCGSPAFPETSEPGLMQCLEEGSFSGSNQKYPVELRERTVRLYRESDPKPVIAQLARELNVHPEALRNWIRQDEPDRGERHDRPTTEMVEERSESAKAASATKAASSLPAV